MPVTIDVRPEDMLVFAAVVRAGTFTRAALDLGLTKQGVSERIARLERALHVRLLERTTRRLRTTEAGAAYHERCQAIATAIAEANDLARQGQTEPAGRLRVASPTLYGRRFLAPVVARYLEQYPRMQVEISLANRPVDLIGDGFDLAIHIGRLKDSDLTTRRLGDGYLYFVASPAYLRTFGTPAPTQLPEARCLGFATVEEWHIDGVTMRVSPVATINDLETLCDLTIAGAGIARLPALVCQDAIDDGRLVRLFPHARLSMRPISVLYPSRTFLPAKVEAFLDVLSALRPVLPSARPSHP
jgi:DNA-binding transcriptional LysR family regulator